MTATPRKKGKGFSAKRWATIWPWDGDIILSKTKREAVYASTLYEYTPGRVVRVMVVEVR